MTRLEQLAVLLDEAIKLPREEVAALLIEPQRRLTVLLFNRSADLAELDALVAELAGRDENFGSF